MAIPSSGPISLTTLQTEFGGANPIGLNEYYAGGGLVAAGTTGTFGPVPSSGTISLQNFYGTTAVTFWVATLDVNWSGAWSHATFASASGVWVSLCNGGYQGAPRSFLSNVGALSPVTLYPGNDQSVYPQTPSAGSGGGSFATFIGQPSQYWTNTSDGSYYVVGENLVSPFTTPGASVVKVNSSGGLVWYRRFSNFSTEVNSPPNQIWRDSSGFNWVCGKTRYNQPQGYVLRLDDNGNLVSSRQFSVGLSTALGVISAVTDGSNNPVVATPCDERFGPATSFVSKLDPTMSTFTWRKQLRNTSLPSEAGYALFVSSLYPSGTTTYASGWTNSTINSTRNALLLSLNSSGNLAWGWRVASDTVSAEGGVVYTDASGNVWWVWGSYSIALQTLIMGISKFNSSGALLFQRGITNVTNQVRPGSVTVVGDVLYITATYNVPNHAPVVLKLPADGTKTGTYGGFTYADYNIPHSSNMSGIVSEDSTSMEVSSYSVSEFNSPNTNTTFTATRTSFTSVP